MKEMKDERVEFRIQKSLLNKFNAALQACGKDGSEIMRDLMVAAVDYIDANGGRWITPALVRAGDEPRKLMAAAEPRGEYSARPLSSARVADPPAGLRAKHTRKAGSRKIA